MPREDKVAIVEELKSRISDSSITIMTQYKGITVEEVTELRKKLREDGVTFKVYKNTLAKRALDDLDLSDAVPVGLTHFAKGDFLPWIQSTPETISLSS